MLFVDAYHEFSYPREMMESIVKGLKPGGRVVQIEYRGEDPDVPIKRLHKMIESENAVAAEFSGPQRAILLFNELQGLKRQKKALDDEQGIFSYDSDRQEVIDVLEAEIKRIRSELTRAKKDGGKKK